MNYPDFNISSSQVADELQQMSEASLLVSEKNGRQINYQENTEHKHFSELQSIIKNPLAWIKSLTAYWKGLDIWACRWIYSHFKQQAYYAVPIKTLTVNIGRDGTGVHSGVLVNTPLESDIKSAIPERLPDRPFFDEHINASFIKSFQLGYRDKFARLVK